MRSVKPGDIVKSLGSRYILTSKGKKISDDFTLIKCYPLIAGPPTYIGATPIVKMNTSIHQPCTPTFNKWFKEKVIKC